MTTNKENLIFTIAINLHQNPIDELHALMETIILHSITAEEFYEKIRGIIKEEIKNALQQDQLLTKEGALKMAGISNAVFLKAISEGLVKPQLIKGRKKAMYLESEVLKIETRKRKTT